MSTFQKIVKNAFANGVGFSVEAIIAFCMLPFILNRIGESAYGIWALTISVTGYMGILNLGLRPAINKYVAQYNAVGEKEKIKDVVQASLFSYLICSIIIVFLSTLLAVFCNQVFNIPAEYQDTASVLIFLMGLQMALGLLAVIYGGVISGMQRYEVNNGIEIFVMLSRTTIILCFLNRFPHIYTIAVAHFSMTIIGYFLTFIMAKRVADIDNIKLFRKPSKRAIVTIFSFSIITFVIGIVGRIMTYVDSVIIASFLTTTAVTYYTVGSRMVKYTKSLIEVLVNVLAPATSALNARNDDSIKKLYLYSAKVCSLIAIPILSFLIIQGHEFLYLWIGQVYPDSYKVMCILSLGGLILFPQLNSIPILYGMAKHKIIMWVSIVEGIISLAISIGLCIKYGVIGIAVGLAFPKAFLGGIIYPVYLSRLIEIRISEIIWNCYLRSLITSLPIVAALIITKPLQETESYSVFFLQLILCGIIHVCSIWVVGLNTDEKTQVISLLKRFKPS